ncbi:SCO6880 family protein [Actinopolyspora halophila]|uniref:SCO6880 family protein n=1 Tax=Actinopolyspora halophila TaxID=1850 RepID=UPI0003829121|nr:SCO6880 family protein [Actinopolyspora halophila]
MTEADTRGPRYRTYGNWHRPRSPGLWGLGTLGTVLLVLTPVAMVLGFVIAIPLGITAGVLGLVLLAPAAITIRGRTVGELAMVRLAFWRSKSKKEHVYLSGSLAEPYGQHTLPGVLAQSELVATRDGMEQPAGVVIVPQTGHYTGVLKLDPEGASLVDTSQIDQWVAGYGHWLSQLAHEPGFAAASVTIETAPDPGTRLATAVQSQRSADAPQLAHEVLDTIVDTYPAGSAQVTAWATVTYRSTGSRRRADRDGMLDHVASRLPGLCDAMRGTGAGAVRPMTAAEIAETVHIAYDPGIATEVEQLRAAGQPTGITWSGAGPKADVAAWDCYRHDSGVSRVWSLDEAPRGTVLAGVLSQLLAPHPMLPRKRVTLTYRPYPPGEAARIVDRDVRAAHFNQQSGRGGQARDAVAIKAAEQAAQEEAEGAGLTRFSLYVAATVDSVADLPDADTIIDGLSGTARIQLRPVYNGQRPAFAVGLPTGIVLPEHTLIPSTVREAL